MSCGICREEFTKKKLLKCEKCELKCCKKCISEWYLNDPLSSCPQCRERFTWRIRIYKPMIICSWIFLEDAD